MEHAGLDTTQNEVTKYAVLKASPRKTSSEPTHRDDDLKFSISATTPLSTEHLSSQDNIFAVIVGIDNYPNFKNLKGSVGDTDRIEDWLLSVLRVPSSNIIYLRNEEATGAGIRRGLEKVADNKDIRANDIFFFYFSGHGSNAHAPASWNMGDKLVSMILPSDFDPKISSAEGSLNEPRRCILNQELGDILEGIAAKKGGLRMLAMFDSCFSGWKTGPNDLTVRNCDLQDYNYKIPENALPSSSIGRRSFFQDRRSHVLLSACGPHQRAYELGNRGYFSDAVLKVFQRPHFENLTMAKQTPQCDCLDLHRTVLTQTPRTRTATGTETPF
ncbi:hypothetical protein H0H93_002772 [Arthromyces matolae]|nr:hypothetical protein H0H93_002772 [Arthromyces matolae]